MMSKPSSPRVSVIVPTCDRPAWLVDALDSVLRQMVQDFEIIVVDDGSTPRVADRVVALDGRIQYLAVDHSGRPGRVRNRGIEMARGALIAFLDDDDTWRADKLAHQLAFLERQPSVGFVYSDARFVRPDASISEPILQPHQKDATSLLHHLLADCFIYPSTVVVRRAALDRVGLFDEARSTGEDYDLWLRLAYVTEAGCIPEPLALIRRHPSGISQQSEILSFQNAIAVLERFLRGADLPLHQRLCAQGALSRWYAHVGLALAGQGDRLDARRYFLRSLRLKPLQRRAWKGLARTRASRSL